MVSCLTCGKMFHPLKTETERGRGKYCSRECYFNAQKGAKRPTMSVLLRQLHILKPGYGFQKGQGSWNKGKKGVFSEETLRKMREANKGRVPVNKGLRGIHYSPDTEFTSERLKKLWQNLEFRTKVRLAWVKSAYKRPNKTEERLLSLIKAAQLPFNYNDSLVIEGLTPDFVATDGSHRLLELFGEPFHDSFSPLVDSKRCYWGRKAIFKSYGYDTLIIWYNAFKRDPLRAIEQIQNWNSAVNNFKKVGKNPTIYPTAHIIKPQNLELGDDVTIMDGVFLNAGKRTIIGNGSQLNAHCILAGGGELEIGDLVTIGYGAVILSRTDSPEGATMVDSQPLSKRRLRKGRIIIGNNAFIGSHSIICINRRGLVAIGANTVIGAGCYVDKNVKAGRKLIPVSKLWMDLPREKR